MIEPGRKVLFKTGHNGSYKVLLLSGHNQNTGGSFSTDSIDCEGTVTQVFQDKRWFVVEYGEPTPWKTCFHFSDVGRTVKFID